MEKYAMLDDGSFRDAMLGIEQECLQEIDPEFAEEAKRIREKETGKAE